MCGLQPFYGGKKNQIVAEVFAPKEKKCFLTIKGEWNGEMYAKFDDSPVSGSLKAKNTKLDQYQPLGLFHLSKAAISWEACHYFLG